ncbi:MAG: cell division protein FtsB [Pelotomaculum sp. PtaU1.Bin035]|nr:MAG: cell division protein FtsB [Pelotomaculum sp. PtaU1.Bin035]
MNQLVRKDLETYVPMAVVNINQAKRRKSFNFSRSKLPALMAVLLLCYLAVAFSSQFSSLAAMQRDVRSIEQEVQELKQKNASLREELQNIQSDAYVEKTARDKLGLVKPGETRVVPLPAGTQLPKIQAPAADNNVSAE